MYKNTRFYSFLAIEMINVLTWGSWDGKCVHLEIFFAVFPHLRWYVSTWGSWGGNERGGLEWHQVVDAHLAQMSQPVAFTENKVLFFIF